MSDGQGLPEPIAPGQSDPEPVENILEPSCWCGRVLSSNYNSDTGKMFRWCIRHGNVITIAPRADA